MQRVLFFTLIAPVLLGAFPWATAQGPAQKPRTDFLGDPLPDGALYRLGTARFRHPGWISALEFTADGKAVISYGQGDPVSWDVATGIRTSGAGLPRHLLSNNAIAAPDQRHVIYFKQGGTEIELHDAKIEKLIFRKASKDRWRFVGFRPDGKTLVAMNQSNQVHAWDIRDGSDKGKQSFDFAPWPRFAEDFPAPTLSLDGALLAGVLKDDWGQLKDPAKVRFWDPLTAKEIRPSITLPRSWKWWSLSTDGKQLTVRYWDLAEHYFDTTTGKEILPAKQGNLQGEGRFPEKNSGVVIGLEHAVFRDFANKKDIWSKHVAPPDESGTGLQLCVLSCLAMSPDKKTVAVGTDSGYIELIDAETGKAMAGSTAHPGFFSGPIQLFPDGKNVFLNHNTTTVVINFTTGKVVRDIGRHRESSVLSPNGKWLADYRFSKEVCSVFVEDVVSGKKLWVHETGSLPEIRFSEEGRDIAFWNWRKSEVQVVATESGQLIRQFGPKIGGNKPDMKYPEERIMELSQDLKQVVVQTADKAQIQLWDATTSKKLWTWQFPADCREHGYGAHFVSGGKRIVVEMRGRTDIKDHLFFLDRATGKTERTIANGSVCAISPDGKYVSMTAVANGASTIHYEVREIESGKLMMKIDTRAGRGLRFGCFSRDGKVFACSPDGSSIEFFDVHTWKPLMPARRHTSFVREATFAPEGRVLAARYNDSTVLFWDAGTTR